MERVFNVEDHTKNPSQNTELFSCLPESVAVIILDVIHAVYSILAWRQSSKSLLAEILSRLAESESFEQTHDEFCDALWPHLEKNRRKEKISRWVSKLKADMELSRFKAVEIPKRKVIRSEEGGFKGRPTVYKVGHFWKMFRYVQDMALEVDLLKMSIRLRRSTIRAIVAQWLEQAGATPIERVKKTDEIKPAKPSLPCSCACDNCQNCRAKSPIPSSTLSSSEIVSVQVEEERARIKQIEEDLVSIGQRRLNRGDKLSVIDNKLNAVAVAARMRIKAAVARKDSNGDYASNTGARARGRASQEMAVAELREMKRVAEEMGEFKHAAKLAEFASVLEAWKLFSSRSGIALDGGQPK